MELRLGIKSLFPNYICAESSRSPAWGNMRMQTFLSNGKGPKVFAVPLSGRGTCVRCKYHRQANAEYVSLSVHCTPSQMTICTESREHTCLYLSAVVNTGYHRDTLGDVSAWCPGDGVAGHRTPGLGIPGTISPVPGTQCPGVEKSSPVWY